MDLKKLKNMKIQLQFSDKSIQHEKLVIDEIFTVLPISILYQSVLNLHIQKLANNERRENLQPRQFGWSWNFSNSSLFSDATF